MKRPIPIARTVLNAFGVNEVFQESILNMFPESPAPVPNDDGGGDLRVVLRSVPGERTLVHPTVWRPLLGDRLLGAAWCEHHNIPEFQNKLLVCGNKGVAMFGINPSPGARGDRNTQFLYVQNSFKAWGTGDLAEIENDVHIASNGFSWMITTDGGRGFIYRPVPSSTDAPVVPTGAGPNVEVVGEWGAELREFTTLNALRQAQRPIPAELAGGSGGLTPTVLRTWWDRREGSGPMGNEPGLYWPEALAEFSGGPRFGSVIFHGGRYIVHERESGRFYWSGVAGAFDQHVFLPLEFATAEGDGDPIVSLISNRKLFYPLGTRTAEVWYSNVGGVIEAGAGVAIEAPYTHAPASDSDRGCVGEFASANIANQAFWLGRDGSVFVGSGRGVSRVTSPAQAEILSIVTAAASSGEYKELSDARLFGWQEFGHDFLAVRVPDSPTIIFDLTTGQWHQRGEDEFTEWRIRGVVEGGTRGRVIAWASDGIYELRPGHNRFDEVGEAGSTGRDIKRRVVMPLVENNRERMRLADAEVLAQLTGENAAHPTPIVLEISRDRAVTTSIRSQAFIREGEPTIFRNVGGTAYDFLFTITYEGTGDLTIFGFYADMSSQADEQGAKGN